MALPPPRSARARPRLTAAPPPTVMQSRGAPPLEAAQPVPFPPLTPPPLHDSSGVKPRNVRALLRAFGADIMALMREPVF